MSNTVLDQVKTLIIRPGAKPGQILLGVDLSEVQDASQVLAFLIEQGYQPQIRYLQLAMGLHVFAVLKEELWMSEAQYDSLQDEWERLSEQIAAAHPQQAVRIWRGLLAIAA